MIVKKSLYLWLHRSPELHAGVPHGSHSMGPKDDYFSPYLIYFVPDDVYIIEKDALPCGPPVRMGRVKNRGK